MTTTKRIHRIRPGWDCDNGPCPSKDCPGSKKRRGGGHGIHGDEWFYAVVDPSGDFAMSLTVYTDIFPDTVAKDLRSRPIHERRSGADLTLHVAFPTDKEAIRSGWTSKGNCDLLPGTWCDASRSTALGARDFFLKHGNPEQPEQSEDFWVALEQEMRAWIERVDQPADELWVQCPHCLGAGVLEKA